MVVHIMCECQNIWGLTVLYDMTHKVIYKFWAKHFHKLLVWNYCLKSNRLGMGDILSYAIYSEKNLPQ